MKKILTSVTILAIAIAIALVIADLESRRHFIESYRPPHQLEAALQALEHQASDLETRSTIWRILSDSYDPSERAAIIMAVACYRPDLADRISNERLTDVAMVFHESRQSVGTDLVPVVQRVSFLDRDSHMVIRDDLTLLAMAFVVIRVEYPDEFYNFVQPAFDPLHDPIQMLYDLRPELKPKFEIRTRPPPKPEPPHNARKDLI
jgi:hypothetical protein